jgi:glycosyltransferase involved in cell wall biosynthesis
VNKLLNEHYSDHIIAVSPAAAENLTDAGISPKYITTVMNGVAPLERCSKEERNALCRQWDVEEDDFVLGILARLEPYKGHLDIVDAAKILAEQGRKFKILVAGSGPFEENVKSRVSELGLNDYVKFVGFLKDVKGFLSVLDVQLNASYGTEATSLSLLEGMSMGVPAIISDYGGNPWLVTDGDNGMLFPTRNSKKLAECIARVMDEPETLEKMSVRAKEVLHQRFTGEIFAKNIENVYMDTLKGVKNGK